MLLLTEVDVCTVTITPTVLIAIFTFTPLPTNIVIRLFYVFLDLNLDHCFVLCFLRIFTAFG